MPHAQAHPPGGGPPFGHAVSANGRYIVDQYGQPWLMAADSAWGLAVDVSTTDMATYFASRQAHGFNCVLVELVTDTYSGISPNNEETFDGINAFTGTVSGPYPDMSTPNSTYWARMDTMVAMGASYGMTMMLIPCDCATSFGDSHNMLMCRANGATACMNFGEFVGARYKSSPNVMWWNGNDYGTAAPYGTDDQYVLGISSGIRAAAPAALQTVEILPGLSQDDGGWSGQGTSWSAAIDLYQSYPGGTAIVPTYDQTAYAASPTKPMYMGEGQYDGGGTNNQLRLQGYWAMVAGGCGQFYGNATVYGFTTGWQAALTTSAVTEFGYWQSLFGGVAWWTLVPDTGNTFLTSGYSSGGSVALGAVNAAGSLGMVYAPQNGPVVIAMTAMRGTTLCRWYDPTLGTFSTVGSYANTGTHSFTSPGNHADGNADYVLVLTA